MSIDKNIPSKPWNCIQWQDGKMMEGLTLLRERAEEQALDAIGWYYAKKKSKNWWSRLLRFFAITFTLFGGLVPILATTGIVAAVLNGFGYAKDESGRQLATLHFDQWGYILIGLAAGCVAFDRFFGFSTNWMRYIGAAMRIETARTWFRFEWEHLAAPLRGADPQGDCLRQLIQCIEAFSLAIREAVEQETGAWIQEFQTNLSQFDKETRAFIESAHRREEAARDERARQKGSGAPC